MNRILAIASLGVLFAVLCGHAANAQQLQHRSPAIPSQIEPLPPVYVTQLPASPEVSPISTPPILSEPLYENWEQPAEPPGPPDRRQGAFQKFKASETWLLSGGGDGFGVHELGTSVTFGFPLPTPKSPLIVRPQFNLYLLDGPAAPDLPSEVYDAGVQLRWIRPINDRWIMDLAVMPGYYADFNTNSSDGVRVTGHGIALWDRSATTKIALGVVYLDRSDVSVVPAAGLIYTPHEDLRWELMFPRPRVTWRPHGWFCEDDWLYVAGELGGGTWAIQRASGAEDLVTYGDYRVVLGWERKPPLALQSRVEIAYVFGRKLEYDSATPDFRPDDTLMLRFGLAF